MWLLFSRGFHIISVALDLLIEEHFKFVDPLLLLSKFKLGLLLGLLHWIYLFIVPLFCQISHFDKIGYLLKVHVILFLGFLITKIQFVLMCLLHLLDLLNLLFFHLLNSFLMILLFFITLSFHLLKFNFVQIFNLFKLCLKLFFYLFVFICYLLNLCFLLILNQRYFFLLI